VPSLLQSQPIQIHLITEFTVLLEPEELEQCVLVVEVWGWGGAHEGILIY
jgi:hypothetical protein